MNDSERLWTGIVLSLFIHFLFILHPHRTEHVPPSSIALQTVMEMPPSTGGHGRNTLQLGRRAISQDAEHHLADARRKAFADYLQAVDDAVHARRLDSGKTDLIGVARWRFFILEDGSFTPPILVRSSGSALLDETARRAIMAASKTVKRPAIIGSENIPMILDVKFQYDLR